MIFGIISSKNCKLTKIGCALKENIALKKTVERLGRNLSAFSDEKTLMDSYIDAIKKYFNENTLLLIDKGDAVKPCSSKMEAIGRVYDADKKKYGIGYWTSGATALTENRQPIPVYDKLYPCKKEGGLGFNAETKATLQFLRKHFKNNNPRVFDSGYDSSDIIKELVGFDEKFIIRQNQNRVTVHNGKTVKTHDVVRGLDCKHEMTYKDKTGKSIVCKIGMTKITLPRLNNL